MGVALKLVGLAALFGAVAIGAAYSPETADKVFPGSGVQAKKLRDALPFFTTAPAPAAATAPARPPASVVVAKAERKTVPVRVDVIGTVQPIASVVLRSRVDSQIDKILISDGAAVKKDDILVKLDARQIQAQIRQAEAAVAKDQVQLLQAQRDVSRYSDLVAKQAGTQINLDTAKTAVAAAEAAIMGDQAALDNLKVQLSFYTISAPMDGRVGTVAMKAGSLARQGEAGTALGTLNQITPIYVGFSVRQDLLADVRNAISSPDGVVFASPQGSKVKVQGKIAVVDNAVDAATGTIAVKAKFENADEFLWPGQLCNIQITLRNEPNAITVPRAAVQSGQVGNFVYVITEGKAKLVPVKPGSTTDGETIILSGLEGGEMVVTEGALLVSNGGAVAIRDPKVPAPKAADAAKPDAAKSDATVKTN